MFYKYTVIYRNGTELGGYAESDKGKESVRSEVERRSFGDFRIRVEEYGEEFPPCNSDYILTV